MESIGAILTLGILFWIIYKVIIAPIIYILSPKLERDAIVLGKSDEVNVRSGINNGSVYSTTDYLVTLRFQDGSTRDFRCSRSLFGQIDRGDDVTARTKGRKLLALR